MNEALEEIASTETPKRGDIIRNVEIVEIEPHRTEEVFIYFPKKYPGWKGLLFPNDEVIAVENRYDAVVNNVGINKLLIFSEVYHNHESVLGKEILVRISGISSDGQPMFKLYGYLGFVNEGNADIGDKIRVKVYGLKSGNATEMFLEVKRIG